MDGIRRIIAPIIDGINHFLEKYSNKIQAFDFSYVTRQNDKTADIESHVWSSDDNYMELYKEFLKVSGPVFTNTKASVECMNVCSERKYDKIPNIDYKYEKFETQLLVIENKETRQWNKYLEEKRYGGFAHTTYYQVYNKIDVGLFLVLFNPLDGFNNKKYEDSSKETLLCISKLEHLILTFLLEKASEVVEMKIKLLEEEKLEQEKFLHQEFIAHRHSVFNLPFVMNLVSAQSALQKNEQKLALVHIENAIKVGNLLNITLFNSFKPDFSNYTHPFLAENPPINTVERIIHFLNKNNVTETNSLDEKKIKINLKNTTNDFVIENVQYLIDVFTLLFNLWLNGINTYETPHHAFLDVTIDRKKNTLIITFENEGAIDKIFLDFVNENIPLTKEHKGQGLSIIKLKLQQLNEANPHIKWSIRAESNTETYRTIFILVRENLKQKKHEKTI